MDSLFQDLRYGLRLFRARPAFTAVAVLTLAVGIGASTAIFSAVSALLMRPLPVADADRVLFGLALREGVDPFGTSLLEYAAYRDSSTLASAGVASQRTFTLIGRDDPERVQAAAVTASYLDTLRVTPVVGRTFTPRDDRPDAAPTAVIAYDLWQRRFQGAAAVAGTTMTLDDGVYTIVGVMPRGFDMPAESESGFRCAPQSRPCRSTSAPSTPMPWWRGSTPGVTPQQADTDLKRIARQLEDEYPRQQRGWTYQLISLRQQLLGDLAGRGRQAMIALEVAVGFLLLSVAPTSRIFCSCAASRGNPRLPSGVRSAPAAAVSSASCSPKAMSGAGRRSCRIAARRMADTRRGAVESHPARIPFDISHRLRNRRPRDAVRGGGVDVTGLLFGIVPVWKAARIDDAMGLLRRREQRAGGAAGRRWLGAVVVVEVAVAVILLVNGSLVVQSFSQLQDLSLGFDPERLLTLEMTVNAQKYPAPSDRAAFVDRVIAQVSAVPGVISAGISTNIPLQHLSQDAAFTVEGRAPANPADVPITAHRLVTPAYLQTLGVRLVKGRLLNEHDRAGAAPVVVISEALARETWPNEDPIGRRMAAAYWTRSFPG